MRTSVKLESGGSLTLSTRAAAGFTCFEFLKVRWVEHVSLSLLSGREMLGDKTARDGVLAEATHLAGGVCVILLDDVHNLRAHFFASLEDRLDVAPVPVQEIFLEKILNF